MFAGVDGWAGAAQTIARDAPEILIEYQYANTIMFDYSPQANASATCSATACCIPRAYRVHTACTPRAHRVHTACIPRAHRVHTACTPRAYRVHTACIPCAYGAAASYDVRPCAQDLLELLKEWGYAGVRVTYEDMYFIKAADAVPLRALPRRPPAAPVRPPRPSVRSFVRSASRLQVRRMLWLAAFVASCHVASCHVASCRIVSC
jgi:hypothetical protein